MRVCVCVCVCVCGLIQQKLISCSYKVHYRVGVSPEQVSLPSIRGLTFQIVLILWLLSLYVLRMQEKIALESCINK